jgi:anti-sigma regulatory factor (Ser/Thr protein kinase)
MAVDFADSLDPLGRLDAIAHGLASPSGADTRVVDLLGMPAAPTLAVDMYLADLSRELAVRRLDPARSERGRDELTENILVTVDLILTMFSPVRQQVVQTAKAAQDDGREAFDLALELPLVAKEAALLLADLLAQVAVSATGAGLLTQPLGDVAAAVFSWFLDSVVAQLSGEPPAPYFGPTTGQGEVPPMSVARGTQSDLFGALHDSRSFPLALESPRAARHFVAGRLREWGLDAHAERSTLPVSELVTNVVVHAQTQAVVQVMAALGRTRVGVRDFSKDQPVLRSMEPTAPFGRGLRIVDQSVSRWGVETAPTGKSVWFELDADDGPEESSA